MLNLLEKLKVLMISFNKTSINILFLCFVSILIIFLQQGEINRDGILYLNQSQYIIEGNWHKAMSVYNWPFFSFLISGVHYLTGLSLQYAAHLINVSLFVLAGFFFLKIVSLVSYGKYPYLFSTLILLTSIPLMDDYLSMILRDQGQWAGFMMGVYGYLRWLKTPHWRWAFMWQSGFILGTFFRPECLIFNILLPLLHQIFFVKTDRFMVFIQSISVPLLSLLFIPLFLIIFKVDVNAFDLGRLNEIVTRPYAFINSILQPLSIDTENYYLKVLIADFAISFKYFFLSYIVVYKWVAGIGFLHLFLFIYTIKQRIISTPYLKALYIFFILSSFVTIINLYSTFVIANRYWVMNFWIVYIFASIGLGHLWFTLQKSKNPNKSLFKNGLAIVLFIYFINVIVDKSETHYEQEAGSWVKKNHINLNNIYFNSQRASYYAGQLGVETLDLETAINVIQYQYLMITYNRFSSIEEILNYQPIEYFPSKEKPKVIIYKRTIEAY